MGRVAQHPAGDEPPDPAMTSPARSPARSLDAVIREVATWLEAPDPERVTTAVAGWPAARWTAFRRVVAIHGLAPHLVRVSGGGLVGRLPADTVAWLTDQDALNEARIRRMHAELAAILAAAEAAGLEVMPLKGAVLTTDPAADPYRRPMADLDLLVHPPDRPAMGEVLRGLGYTPERERNRRPTHDVFVDAGGGRVVAPEGEHPDNPRRVEVHTEVKRHLWGWVDDDDLTAALWSGSRRGTVLGRPATLPRPDALASHVAIHASSDLLVGRGRLVQWLDLAWLAGRGAIPADPPHPRVAYPAVRLAARALPLAMAGLDLGRLEALLPPRLVRWAGTVPLDSRCGLTTGRPPDAPSGVGARWERWRPEPWRLAVAYGDVPLPVALARHAGTVAGRARRRPGRAGRPLNDP